MPSAYASSVLNAPADTVWDVIRSFDSLSSWYPAVASCEIEDGQSPDAIGCIRSVRLEDGTQIRERLLDVSGEERSYSYSFQTTPFEVENHRATLRVTPVTDGGRSFIEWWATFDCAPETADKWIDIFATGVFQTGFTALKQRFGG